MSIYNDLAATVRELLDPGQLGAASGSIVLVRRTVTPAANSWEDPTVTLTSETLLAQAFGVSGQLVGLPADEPADGVIVASDRTVVAALPEMGYQPGDLLTIDGTAVTVIRVEQVPAAGVPSAVKFVVR